MEKLTHFLDPRHSITTSSSTMNPTAAWDAYKLPTVTYKVGSNIEPELGDTVGRADVESQLPSPEFPVEVIDV